MTIRIGHITTLLVIAVILLAGCDGNKQKPPEQVEQPVNTPREDTPTPQVLIQEEEKPDPVEPPTLTQEQLPDAFPDTLTPENRDIWIALVTVAAKAPKFLQKILPDKAERANEIFSNVLIDLD